MNNTVRKSMSSSECRKREVMVQMWRAAEDCSRSERQRLEKLGRCRLRVEYGEQTARETKWNADAFETLTLLGRGSTCSKKVDVDMLIEINWRFASYCHLCNIQDGLTFDVHWAVLSRKLAIKMSFVLVVILYVCCSYSRVWTSNLPRVDTLWFWRAQVLATTSAPLHPEICRRPFCVLWRPEAIQTFQLLQFFHNLISFQGCLPRVCVTYCFADVMFVL